ncbi:MAG: hypothetical protein KDJ75_05810 [Alphaproteobacteria bacterium]|nr:hypothetical protein [Alphaproteobacteria bacterium]
MLRSLFVAGLSFLIFSHNALAAESVRIRTGEHDEYSRLVFDWPESVEYDVENVSEDTLRLSFKKAASLDVSKANPVANIRSMDILSETPLRLTLSIPAGSRSRVFRAGERVVVDIYNPPGGAPAAPDNFAVNMQTTGPVHEPVHTQEPAQTQAQIEKPPTPPLTMPEHEAEPAPVTKIETAPPIEHPAPAKPPAKSAKTPAETEHAQKPEEPEHDNMPDTHTLHAPTATPAVEPEKVESEPLAPLEKLAKERSPQATLISLSSTQALGVGVFELRDGLWLINNRPDLFVSPSVSGPEAGYFTPLRRMDLDNAKAYITKTRDGTQVKGEGGGIFWKIVISAADNKHEPVKPERIGVDKNETRGGHILWPFKEADKIISLTDPVSGRTIQVVTVKNAKDFAGPALQFVDFETLPSPVGLAVVPKVDDLEISITSEGVKITRPGGLTLMPEEAVLTAHSAKLKPDRLDYRETRRIFDFGSWQMGGLDAMQDNKNIILAGLHDSPESQQIENIVTLAKMHLANGHAPEALGFLRFAHTEVPDLETGTEFLALRGAARALAGQSESAFHDLSIKPLADFEEIGFWRAFVLADLGDWQQAMDVLPKNIDTLYDYPAYVIIPLGLGLAEVELRAGRVQTADEILRLVESNKNGLLPAQEAALHYLQGESARQQNDIDRTKALWENLAGGPDDRYRAKAGLALTRLEADRKDISPEEAIDNLERLRYAWRGDQLEVQIGYWLGRAYFEAKDYIKGLNIMREAASHGTGTRLADDIAQEMTDGFTQLYLGPELEKLSAMQAVALYEEFSELVPVGKKGDQIVEMLAERLVQADLLNRAGNLLEHQVEHRLSGEEAYRVGVRLAAIRLLDRKPDKAEKALNLATSKLQTLPAEAQTPDKFLELSLLRARALSRRGRPDQALALLDKLDKSRDVNRLRADIAWEAGYWDDAAAAFEDVILDKNISLTRPLDQEDSILILHRAVALNLSNNRVALTNMREKYADAMAQTDKARAFEVITRARQSAALADRETLMSVISEVDLFGDFLNNYKAAQTPSN